MIDFTSPHAPLGSVRPSCDSLPSPGARPEETSGREAAKHGQSLRESSLCESSSPDADTDPGALAQGPGYRERLDLARRGGGLRFAHPESPGERGRRARMARALVWAAEGRLAELSRDAVEGPPFGLLSVTSHPGHWMRWRRYARGVFEEHLERGRDHHELDCLAQVLDVPRGAWPSPASLAAASAMAGPGSRVRRVRAQALVCEGAWEPAARCLSRLLAPDASAADRLAACLGWARLHRQSRRPGPARHALRAAVVRAPLAPQVWRLAQAMATQLGDRSTRDCLARGARVVRRLERARESRSPKAASSGESAPPAAPAPPGADLPLERAGSHGQRVVAAMIAGEGAA
jgi:hypothetical protein